MELVKIETVDDVKKFSAEIKKYIFENKMFMDIHGKGYIFVDGWSLVGGMMGVTPIVRELENISDETTIRYRSTVELIKNGQTVGMGIAICTNKEKGKTAFDEYAVASMAQTRAIGKAYRIYIGWIMKMAGFQTTPAEEMDSVDTTVTPEKLKKIVEAYQDGDDTSDGTE